MDVIRYLIVLLIIVLIFVLPRHSEPTVQYPNVENTEQIEIGETYYYDATKFGLSPLNTGKENSTILQMLVNSIPVGETIYIPSGEYEFAAIENQTIGSHCVKMRSDVNIVGDGDTTILLPVGNSAYGLDMFYFNELLDINSAIYLENCTFRDFVIDAIGTSSNTYTSAGKGFMFNLYKNCHWENVIVVNTDGTGFGMDCPIDCTITNCVAINCGKAATTEDGGASGFGIGFGYSDKENIKIINCTSIGNKKFGFFFEHQGIFNSNLYQAKRAKGFLVKDCRADGNYYNFGGVVAKNVIYNNCISKAPISNGFHFEDSTNCSTINCREE